MSKFVKQCQRKLIASPSNAYDNLNLNSAPIKLKSHQFRLWPAKYPTVQQFIDNFQPPAFIDENLIPTTRTDIRGIDSAGYTYLHKKMIEKKSPIILNNQFIQIRYFPDYHNLSKIRKSNIAIGNINGPLSLLNDAVLQQRLKAYKGKYRNHSYFNERRNPLVTAVNRARMKKIIKQCFVEALQQKVDERQKIRHVRGFYFVRYHKFPRTDEDKAQLLASISSTINDLLTNVSLQNDLHIRTKKHNKLIKEPELMSQVNRYNTYGERAIPLYYPKLPFIRSGFKRESR